MKLKYHVYKLLVQSQNTHIQRECEQMCYLGHILQNPTGLRYPTNALSLQIELADCKVFSS